MTFFGLTALGPQNTFAETLSNTSLLHIFDECDFKKAFDGVANGQGQIGSEDIQSVLNAVYHGPAPGGECGRLRAALGDVEESISWETFRAAFIEIRNELEHDATKKETQSQSGLTSFDEYRDATHRHVRTKLGPQKLYVRPVTSGQDYGWDAHGSDGAQKIFGKRFCPETLYASAMVKGGILY